MPSLSAKQRRVIAAAAKTMRKAGERGLTAINDNPMYGEMWTALNVAISAADALAAQAEG